MSEGISINNNIVNGAGTLPVAGIGLLSARPPFGIPKQIYFATDVPAIYYDNGAAWVTLLTQGGGGTLTGALNGLSVSGANVVLGGAPLDRATVIDTGGQIFAMLPTSPAAGGLLTVQPTTGTLGFNDGSGAGGSTSVGVADNLVQVIAHAATLMQLTDLLVSFGVLANTDVAGKWLQADATGIITNAELPISKADNGISIGSGGDANKIQLGGTLTKGTLIRNNTATGGPFRFAFIPAVGQDAAYWDCDTAGIAAARIGWLTSLNVFTGVTGNATNVLATIAGTVRLSLSATQFISSLLANAVVTKFLQADASGIVTSVTAPVATADNGLTVTTNNIRLGGSLVTSTVINAQGHTFIISSIAAATDGGLLALDSNHGEVSFQNAAGNRSQLSASITALEGQVNNIPVFTFDQTTVKLNALANAVTSKFLQADATGLLSNVAAFTDIPETAYVGTVTFGGTPPSGATTNNYRGNICGKSVQLLISLLYATPGVSVTSIKLTLPAGVPVPATPTGFATNNTPIGRGLVNGLTALGTTTPNTNPSAYLEFDGTNWVLQSAAFTGAALTAFVITANYISV